MQTMAAKLLQVPFLENNNNNKKKKYKLMLMASSHNNRNSNSSSIRILDVRDINDGDDLLLVPLEEEEQQQQQQPSIKQEEEDEEEATADISEEEEEQEQTSEKEVDTVRVTKQEQNDSDYKELAKLQKKHRGVNNKEEKKDDKDDDDKDNNDDDFVEDATKEVLEQRKKEIEVIELSSDSDSEDDNEDVKIKANGPVEEGEDGWEESSDEDRWNEDYNDEDEEEDEEEEKDKDEIPHSLGLLFAFGMTAEEYKSKTAGKKKDTAKRKSVDGKLDTKPKAKRPRKSKVPAESPLRVKMDPKDVPNAPGKSLSEEEVQNASKGYVEVSTLVDGPGSSAEQVVKDRIIKLLNTGFHLESNENEAHNAMKLAQRLMQKHNLSQALLLKEREEKNENNTRPDGEILKGGLVTVHIYNRKTRKPAVFASWINNLVHPITDNFNVESFCTIDRGYECSVTFYGIYSNAQLAGYAFKVAVERIAQMTAEYQPQRQRRRPWDTPIGTRSSRLSYAIGIVKGIQDDVDRTIEMEKERRLRKLERARQAVTTGEAYEESDNEDNEIDFDTGANGDGPGGGGGQDTAAVPSIGKVKCEDDAKAAARAAPTPAKPVSGEELDRRLKELENENSAALTLVNHQEKIAKEVLEKEGIKTSAGRARRRFQFDQNSYKQGIEDAKEIDINQRAIRDEVKVKKEK